jgi:hypothetical protein
LRQQRRRRHLQRPLARRSGGARIVKHYFPTAKAVRTDPAKRIAQDGKPAANGKQIDITRRSLIRATAANVSSIEISSTTNHFHSPRTPDYPHFRLVAQTDSSALQAPIMKETSAAPRLAGNDAARRNESSIPIQAHPAFDSAQG